MTDDATMVSQAQGGNRRAFDALVRKYHPLVYSTAFAKLRHAQDAEDAAQETFVAAYMKLRSLRDAARFGGWLRMIALNVCRMRQRSRRTELEPLDAATTGFSRDRPDDLVERAEAVETVERVMRSLPEAYRNAASMFYMDGLSYREIGEKLDAPISTVQSRLQRARRMIKERVRKVAEKLSLIRDVAFSPNPLVAGKGFKVTVTVEDGDKVASAVGYDPDGNRYTFRREEIDGTTVFTLDEMAPYDAAPGMYTSSLVLSGAEGTLERTTVQFRVV